MPTETIFILGEHALSSDESRLAYAICDEANITSTNLYCKWEAWALSHNKPSTVPSLSDLQALQAQIRAKLPKPTVTPQKPQLRTIHHPIRPTPTRVNVDDFFSMLDESEVAPPHADPPPFSPLIVTLEPPKKAKTPIADVQPDNNDHLFLAGASVGKPRNFSLKNDDVPDELYTNRQAPGRVESTINGGIPDNEPRDRREQIKVHPLRSGDATPRYMNDEILAKIESIRGSVRAISERILLRMKHNRASDAELPKLSPESFFVPSPDVVLAVGRIRVELDESEGVAAGRINPSSVVLESEDGNMVKLNLSRIHEQNQPLFLHPGMVVVVEGVNTNGRSFQVHAIYDNAMALPTSGSGRQLSAEPDTDVDGEAIADDDEMPDLAQPREEEHFATALFAAGPFTTNSNLNYEPLDDLLDAITTTRPDVVFLFGPFVDSKHDQISMGTPVPFEQIFETRILARLRGAIAKMSASENSSPQFLLVPSLADVHHDFVCPQPAFRPADDGQPSEILITMLTNPSLVELSAKHGRFAATVGLSSLPALQDISGDCLCWNKGDRFSAIASHMLRQCTFYPTFPPTPAVPLDSTLAEHLSIPDLERSPTIDVLVCPSKLKAFVKNVDGGAIAVNPGLLCRGSSGGTYAELRVPLHDIDKLRPLNANEDRLRASIVRV